MILTRKPSVHRMRSWWCVEIEHSEGHLSIRWRTRLAAMNCALAIARTSKWDEDRCKQP